VQHAEDVEASGQLRARLQETESQLAVMRAERDALRVSCLRPHPHACPLRLLLSCRA
jgi:hypothetical protein